MVNKNSSLAPLIAIIGCDGSGKSTVGEATLIWVREYGPAVTAHLGKQQGTVARQLIQWPLIGKGFERLLDRKVKAVRKSRAEKTTPGIITAIIMYAFTLRRVRRFRKMMALRKKGFIIIADRYPQLEHSRASDSPDFFLTVKGNFIVRWLARRELQAFEWMTSYKPDLVIRLNVDLDTACARKPDHLREALQRKIEMAPLLKFNGAPIIDIDGTLPLEEVLAIAKEAVTKTLIKNGYKQIKL